MSDHPYGWLSLAPPLAAVVLAIATKRAVVSLLAGLYVGALILSGGEPLGALIALLESHLWATLADPWQVRLFGFLVLIGAMIGVVNRCGGMHGLVQLITPLAKSRRRGQTATWLAGLAVFFDDYTNTLLVGATMRSTCDRLRISREKLAYIVDSTAAPVAGIALLSTWVAVEIKYIGDGIAACDPAQVGDYTDLGVFLGCLPYRFYIIQALLFVPIIALTGRDFGPMLKAERDAALRSPNPDADPAGPVEEADIAATHWANAVIPLGVTLAVVVAVLYASGLSALSGDEAGDKPSLQQIFGAADSPLALFYGSLVGLAVAWIMARSKRILTQQQAADAAFAGTRSIVPGMTILLLASTMSQMTRGDLDRSQTGPGRYPQAAERLYTGDYLQSLLPREEEGEAGTRTLALMLPTVIFLMASVVAFSTGTSYGTMGILFPVIAPVAFATLGPTAGVNASEPLLLASFGAVLSGAIFGDHCSPISDTTILSSQASGCDHVAHVVTQLPYALTVAAIVIVLGTAPLAMGVSFWLLLPLQTAALVGVAMLLGSKVDIEPREDQQSSE